MIGLDTSDYFSGFMGLIIFALGLVPLLEQFGVVKWGVSAFIASSWFLSALPYLLAGLGLYLAIESLVELTNSNGIGWLSLLIGLTIMVMGLLPALNAFGIGPGLFGIIVPQTIYHIIFIIEGLFLMIAMFAMNY
jgi:hypothetical protein